MAPDVRQASVDCDTPLMPANEDKFIRRPGRPFRSSDYYAQNITTDISQKDEIKKLVDKVSREEPKGIQLLINNAGIARDYATEFAGNPAPDFQDAVAVSEHFWKSDPRSWQQNFTTNCMGGYFMSIAFLPLLAKGCDVVPGYSSSVINVTSNSAFLKNTTRGHISYGASKAGFVHLSRMLAHLFSRTRVRVNMIAPGTFPTEVG
ncbi:MAG: hypothetical protein Q9220_002187 [cf. Caloplaca sp. 1 TL-2023]